MNNNWLFKVTYFVLLGLVSIVGQVVILREITTLLHGNEMFYGVSLAIWLFFSGLGSMSAIYLPKRWNKTGVSVLLLMWTVLLIPLLVILLRLITANYIAPGMVANMNFSLILIMVVLAIFCIPLGLLFPQAVKSFLSPKRTNQAYLWETIGFALGGVLFSFILATTAFPLTDKLNLETLEGRFPNVEGVVNSPYGQLVKTEDIYGESVYINGNFAFSSNEDFENIRLVDLLSPFSGTVERVLVMADPHLANSIKERYPTADVRYIVTDIYVDKLIEEMVNMLPEMEVGDPRLIIREDTKRYDLILNSPGSPDTLLGNRFYTQEYFEDVEDILTDKGLFVLLFYLPTDYQSDEARVFAASIYKAFSGSFSHFRLLNLSDQVIILGSKQPISIDETQVDPVWNKEFEYFVSDEVVENLTKILSEAEVEANSDYQPTAYWYQQLFWQTMYDFELPKIMGRVGVFIPGLILVVLSGLLFRGSYRLRLGLLASISSLILLSLEMVTIFLFQTFIGNLYTQISLIFAAVLIGMAFGVVLALRIPNKVKSIKLTLLLYPMMIAIYAISSELKLVTNEWFFLFFMIAGGMIGGLVFALVNRMYLSRNDRPGYIYAFDLFGGALGAIITTVFLLPYVGVNGLMMLMLVLVLMCQLVHIKVK